MNSGEASGFVQPSSYLRPRKTSQVTAPIPVPQYQMTALDREQQEALVCLGNPSTHAIIAMPLLPRFPHGGDMSHDQISLQLDFSVRR